MKKSTFIKVALFVFSISLAAFIGCKKDKLFNQGVPTNQEITHVIKQPADKLTVQVAGEFFDRKQDEIAYRSGSTHADSVQMYLSRIHLLWNFADTIQYMQNVPIILVPVAVGPTFDANIGNQLSMVFFINEYGEIDSRLLFIYAPNCQNCNSNTFASQFSGDIIQMDWQGNIVFSFRFTNGNLSNKIVQNGQVSFRDDESMACDTPVMLDIDGVTVSFLACVTFGGGSLNNGSSNPFNYGPNPNTNDGHNIDPPHNTGGGSGNGNGNPPTMVRKESGGDFAQII